MLLKGATLDGWSWWQPLSQCWPSRGSSSGDGTRGFQVKEGTQFSKVQILPQRTRFHHGIPLTYPQSENWTTVFFYGTHFIIPLNNT